MDFDFSEFDETEISAKTMTQAGGGMPTPGVYHANIESVLEEPAKGWVEFKCRILSPGSECGKTFKHRQWVRAGDPSDRQKVVKTMEGVLRLAYCLGLTDPEAFAKNRAKLHIEWALAAGMQFIATLKPRSYTDANTGEMREALNVYVNALTDESAAKKVAAFDREMYELQAGHSAPEAQRVLGQAAPPTATKRTPAPAQSAPTDFI